MLTTTTQGSFISDGASRIIAVPQGIDWFKVINYTSIANATNNKGIRFEWYNGMAVNGGLMTRFTAAAPAMMIQDLTTVAKPGFTVIDTTDRTPSDAVVITGTTNAAAPVVTTAAGGTIQLNADETVVRIAGSAAAPTICGIDYSVAAVNHGANTFTLPTHATALPAGAAATFRIISYTADPMIYPATRTVINVTQAANAVVTTSVVHNYTVGQKVRMHVPTVCGMTQLDDVVATVLTTPTAYTFTIDVDTTAYTAFAWPLIADFPNQVASVVPAGLNCVRPYVNSFDTAYTNNGFKGMLLGYDTATTGAQSPCGANNDLMYWQAGKIANL